MLTCVGPGEKPKFVSSHNGPFDYYVFNAGNTNLTKKKKKKKASRRIRFGTVTAPSAPPRGALPVQQFHCGDESKILGE